MKRILAGLMMAVAVAIGVLPGTGVRQASAAGTADSFRFPRSDWGANGYGFRWSSDWTFGQCPSGTYEKHPAEDAIYSAGTPVYASANGTVWGILKDPRWGYGILIQHSVPNEGTVMTQYWHVNPLVHRGDTVYGAPNPTQIGTVYDLGSNSHIHFGVFQFDPNNFAWRGHLPVNPCNGAPAFPYKFVDPVQYVQSHWGPLSGTVPPPPTYSAPPPPPAGPMWISDGPVDTNVDGRLELVSQTVDTTIAHDWQFAPNNDWYGWTGYGFEETLGSASKPVIVHDQDGRLEAFALFADGTIRHTYQCGQNGQPGYRCPNDWSPGWSVLSGGGPTTFISNPAVVLKQEGILEVFAVGSDHAVWHMWQTAPNYDWTYSWQSLGGSLSGSRLAVGKNADGRVEVFGVDTGGNFVHAYQCGPYCQGAWSPFSSLGGGFDANYGPALGTDSADGRLELFALKPDGSMWHIYQCGSYCQGAWSTWQAMSGGPFTSNPMVGRNSNGALEVFALSGVNLYHVWQTCGGCAWYGGGAFQLLGSPPGAVGLDNLGIGTNQDGRLEAFVQNGDTSWFHIYQCGSHCSTGWSAWFNMGLPNVISTVGLFQ